MWPFNKQQKEKDMEQMISKAVNNAMHGHVTIFEANTQEKKEAPKTDPDGEFMLDICRKFPTVKYVSFGPFKNVDDAILFAYVTCEKEVKRLFEDCGSPQIELKESTSSHVEIHYINVAKNIEKFEAFHFSITRLAKIPDFEQYKSTNHVKLFDREKGPLFKSLKMKTKTLL
jgi:hypothetical protein